MPHPTGYPTYQLALRAIIAVFGGDPGRSGAWLSAICTALAAALLADLAWRLVAALGSPTSAVHRTSGALSRGGAAATIAALAWAAAPTVWGQATITEVYSLNALLCVALLWLLWRWAECEDSRALWAAGLVFGVGLGNHLSLVLMLPGLAAWVWVKKHDGILSRRDLFATTLCALLGLLVYSYLPLAAAGRPPINWGDPVTPERFLWTVSGRMYAGLPFGLPLAASPARLLGWVSEAMWQFGGPWGLLLALAGSLAPPGPRSSVVVRDVARLPGLHNLWDRL